MRVWGRGGFSTDIGGGHRDESTSPGHRESLGQRNLMELSHTENKS